jgi:hypothetical protein
MKKLILILCIISLGISTLNAKDKKQLAVQDTGNIIILNTPSTTSSTNKKEKWKLNKKNNKTEIQVYSNSNGVKFKSNSKIIITINTNITNVEDIENIYNIKFVRYMKSGDIHSSIKEALFINNSGIDTARIINNITSDESVEIEGITPDLIFNMMTF